MSRRHLLLDSTQNVFRVRDVGSANGTFLNNAPVRVQELRAGDRIRAGMTIFLVSIKEGSDNPHEEDGISFSGTTPREMADVPTEVIRESNLKNREMRTLNDYGIQTRGWEPPEF